ncbi:MAG: MBL fold metallo-hydrolase, partial [Proteobacteria bacterium]|nr:MBL fold metallo-hydrolase [Pseudomonadota bacterium]
HHGTPDCNAGNKDEAVQVFKYSADTFILRQNICITPEAPFMYLLFGESKVLLLDTGDESNASIFPLRTVVDRLIDEYLKAQSKNSIQLIVAHTHGHSDHIAGDSMFKDRAETQILGLGQKAVQDFFHFKSWDGPAVSFDLGARILDVMPIPGHLDDHIAIYDRKTSILLSGDSLYPGRLYVQEGTWPDYKASMQRLSLFLKDKPLNYILGAHIEMSKNAGVSYPFEQTSRPDEHQLELYREHLNRLVQSLAKQDKSTCFTDADFIIWPFDAVPACD